MNIQIFGTKKCNDTKKAERFFKERGIKYQFIDMKEKGMSKGEFNSVAQVNGGLENMINWEGKDKDLLALIKYTVEEDKLAKVLEKPQVLKTPVVRNEKQSTLGRMFGRNGSNCKLVPSATVPYRDGDNPNRKILWMEVHNDPINQQKRNRN